MIPSERLIAESTIAESQITESLIDLIGDIYEAASRPEHWDAVLAGLCRILDVESGDVQMAVHTTDVQRRITDRERGTDEPFAGLPHLAAVRLLNGGDWRVGLTLRRDLHAQPLTAREQRLLDTLAPHFQRALRIQKALYQARHRAASLQSALAGLMHGALIINPSDRVSYCNAAAKRVLSRHPALTLHDGRLRAHYQQDAARLWGLLARLRQGDTSQKMVGLRHPDRVHPLTVTAAVHDVGSDSMAAPGSEEIVLYLSDPDGVFQPSMEALVSVFQLTRAESSVVIGLVNGLSLQDIAEHHDIDRETVRSHLKRIFVKLGVNKQQDVIRLVLNSELNRTTRMFSCHDPSPCP